MTEPTPPRTNRIMKYFNSKHLPMRLQEVAHPVEVLAIEMERTLPDGPELSAGLRKLLEAKDCFVRAALDLKETVPDPRVVTPPNPGFRHQNRSDPGPEPS